MAVRHDELVTFSDDVDLERDRTLVERCQAGDSEAFASLYTRYHERLIRFCQRRLHDREEAQDAAQEAFARAWRALPQFAGERRFYPWLTVIAGNICTDIQRRHSRSTPVPDTDIAAQRSAEPATGDSCEDLVMAASDGALATQALTRLSERHRKVLLLREGSGWSYQQIAAYEGVEVGTIETLLWRARQALKREFAALSESRALAGLALATGLVVHRVASFVTRRFSAFRGTGGGAALRNAVAGLTVASAAVAAAATVPGYLAHHTRAVPPAGAATSPAAPSSARTVPAAAGHRSPATAATASAPAASATTPTTATSATSSATAPAGTGTSGATGATGATGSSALPPVPQVPAVPGPAASLPGSSGLGLAGALPDLGRTLTTPAGPATAPLTTAPGVTVPGVTVPAPGAPTTSASVPTGRTDVTLSLP